MERDQQILAVANAVDATFSESNWTEIGFLTGTSERIQDHPRLLRSLRFGDPDYKGHVLNAVAHMIDKDPANLRILAQYASISTWLSDNDPGAYQSLQAQVFGTTVAHVEPTGSAAALHAMADAQVLLESRGPASAVDRVHTAIHGFLQGACDDAGLSYADQATPNQLLKLIIQDHPNLQSLGPRTGDVQRLLKTSGAIIDAMGTLRNNASLAHPNEALLDKDEALLVVNLARTLLSFLTAKLERTAPPTNDPPF